MTTDAGSTETYVITQIPDLFRFTFPTQWPRGMVAVLPDGHTFPSVLVTKEIVAIRDFFLEQTGDFPGYTLGETDMRTQMIEVRLTADPLTLAMYYLSRSLEVPTVIDMSR